jgi:hypothetical protein
MGKLEGINTREVLVLLKSHYEEWLLCEVVGVFIVR